MKTEEPSAQWTAFVAAATALERVIEEAPAQTQDVRLAKLMLALDELAIAFQIIGDDDIEADDGTSSPNTYDARRSQVMSAYPELGLYSWMRPVPFSESEQPAIGDAVDDLSDILRDIDDAIWEAREHGWRDGAWSARFSWEHHAGAHLVDLRAHIYRLRWFGN